jgi:hypothetical protein
MHEKLVQALRALGLFEAFLQEVHHTDPGLRPARLQEFKERAEKVYRKLALELHPDRGGDTERMALVNAAMDLLRATEIRLAPAPRPIPQGVQVRVVVVGGGFPGFGGWTNSATTSSFTPTGGGWPW